MSIEDLTPSPGICSLADGWSEALNVVGMVLTTETPSRWQPTQLPALLNSAIDVPSGLNAPTLETGTTPASGCNTGPCAFGRNPAGYMCRGVESLPAEA